MIKLWYVYVNLCERRFLSKHVRKNEAPLIADFVLDLFQLWYVYIAKTIKGYWQWKIWEKLVYISNGTEAIIWKGREGELFLEGSRVCVDLHFADGYIGLRAIVGMSWLYFSFIDICYISQHLCHSLPQECLLRAGVFSQALPKLSRDIGHTF